jgi:RNA polymerase I-specific transcription initiation factor RRN5
VEQMLSEDAQPATCALPYKKLEHGVEVEEMDNVSESNTSINTSDDDDEEVEIKREANEVLRHSVADFPKTYRIKETLHNRIALERQEEEHAERCDGYASYQEELEMWRLLQQEPVLDLPKRTDPGKLSKTTLDVEGIYPIGRDWSNKLQFRSEWETSE